MADTEQKLDKSKVPEYPENVETSERKDTVLSKIPPRLNNPDQPHPRHDLAILQTGREKWWNNSVTGTVNVSHGEFRFPNVMSGNWTCCVLKLQNIYSGHRKGPHDNTSFNFYNKYDQIVLHLSFRRDSQKLIDNTWTPLRGWGAEHWSKLPSYIVDERGHDLEIWRPAGTTFQGDARMNDLWKGVEGYWDGLEGAYDPPDSLTYRANNENDPMFGENVDVEFRWYE